MRQIPETYAQKDWPRKVARTVNGIVRDVNTGVINSGDGYSFYSDTNGATQALTANNEVIWTNDAQQSEFDTYQPSDVESFWSNNKLLLNEGDAVLLRVNCWFTPDDAAASKLLLRVKAGSIVLATDPTEIDEGQGVAHPIEWTVLIFAGTIFPASGGDITVEVDGSGDLSEKKLTVARVFKA